MERKLMWRMLLFTFFAIYSIIYLLPTMGLDKNLPAFLKTDKKVLRGLDLAGGVHLEYAIDADVIIENQLDNWGEDIKARLMDEYKEKDKDESSHFSIDVKGSILSITFKDKIDENKLNKAVENYIDSKNPKITKIKTSGKTVYFEIDSDFSKDLESKALTRAVETIRDRVDEFGVAAPEIYRKDNMIVVELPGLDKHSQERIKRIIMRSAHLEFKMVDSGNKYMFDVGRYLRKKYGIASDGTIKKTPYKGIRLEFDSYGSRKAGNTNKTMYLVIDVPSRSLPTDQQREYNKARKKIEHLFEKELPKVGMPVPSGREIGFERDIKRTRNGIPTSQKIVRAMLLFRHTKVTGEYIVKAQVGYNQQGQAVVNATFNRTGGKYFGKMTGKYIGWKMAIKLDDWVASAPVIQSQIFENVQITLGSSGTPQQRYKEAQDLVGVLRSGSLPAPLTKEMELNMGPSLGQEAIRRGTMAFAIGISLVVLFMIVYYRWSGFIAVSALILNVIFIMAIMAGFEARLTLPGIAGIVLTMGMAVDANVIIFERIREELRLGKKPRAAIDSAYNRAFWTIMDSQITTAIAGVVLYEFGTGPIKGFAVTLIIGIITSIITGVFFTRVIFDYVISRKNIEKLSI